MSNLPHLCQMWQASAKLEHVDEDAQEPNVRISAPSLTSFNRSFLVTLSIVRYAELTNLPKCALNRAK